MSAILFHLVSAADWEAMVVDGAYRPPSLATEGFVHLSAPDQVAATHARFYAAVPDLLVVSIDAAALGDALVWEDLMGHGEFPHCYGPVPLSAVTDVQRYQG
jgi:uncharacterized protein (DUF952 family)